jgi:hypothetical protein
MWLTWTIRPDLNASTRVDNPGVQMSSVSLQRLKELSSRLEVNAEGDATVQLHQLVRFNLYNFGEQSVTVDAIGLQNLRGEPLSCELVPSIVVGTGARHPVMVEVMNGPVAEAAQVAVDVCGQRTWVRAQYLPRL